MSEPGSQARSATRWYRHPLAWLGSFILLASLAGCAWMVVMASRYPDPPLDTGNGQAFRMPLESESTPGPRR